jgi:hypothetical protein
MSRSVEKDKLNNKSLPEALADEKIRCQDLLLVQTSARNRKSLEKKIRDIDSILRDLSDKKDS